MFFTSHSKTCIVSPLGPNVQKLEEVTSEIHRFLASQVTIRGLTLLRSGFCLSSPFKARAKGLQSVTEVDYKSSFPK